MKNKIIIMLLLLFTFISSLYGNENFNSDEIEIYQLSTEFSKVIEMLDSDNTDLIIDGKITNIEPVVIKLNEDEEVVSRNRDLMVYQKVTFKVNTAYKYNKPINKEIIVWVEGGDYTYKGKQYRRAISHTAHPFLDIGDKILMALKEKESGGFKIYYGKKMQLPSTKEIIENIEKQKIKKQKKKILMSEKALTLSSTELENTFKYFDSTLEKKVNKKLLKLESIKSYLKINFSKTEVLR